MLTLEDLMEPRYKVIADYPLSHYKVGEVIGLNMVGGLRLSQYPHLFKKLQWWEDRKPEEYLPEYLKRDGKVFKVKEGLSYDTKTGTARIEHPKGEFVWLHNCLPATKEEYDNYKISYLET